MCSSRSIRGVPRRLSSLDTVFLSRGDGIREMSERGLVAALSNRPS